MKYTVTSITIKSDNIHDNQINSNVIMRYPDWIPTWAKRMLDDISNGRLNGAT